MNDDPAVGGETGEDITSVPTPSNDPNAQADVTASAAPAEEEECPPSAPIPVEMTLQEDSRSTSTATVPDLKTQVPFIFNNISFKNIANHVHYIRNLIKTDDEWKWLSHYLVYKRTTTEPNFHNLYSHFVFAINVTVFTESVISETYAFITSLLKSPLMTSNNSDKTCLKHLGGWLGLMTLARNRPILTIEVDLKLLLMEAFFKGKPFMRFVFPFVSKTIEPAAQSKIFRIPNPWFSSVLSIMLEIVKSYDDDTTFKMEFEVLLRNMRIDINHVQETSYFSSYEYCSQLLAGKEQLATIRESKEAAASSVVVGPPGSNAVVGMAAILMRNDFNSSALASSQNYADGLPLMPKSVQKEAMNKLSDSSLSSMYSSMGSSNSSSKLSTSSSFDSLSLSASIGSFSSVPAFPVSDGNSSSEIAITSSSQSCVPISLVPAGTSATSDITKPNLSLIIPNIAIGGNGSGSSLAPVGTGYKPKYTVLDIRSGLDIGSVSMLLDIRNNIPAVVLHPQLRRHIPLCIFKTITDILPGLLDRASKIALTTTEALIKKDFCMCIDERLVRSCAHNMISHLVSGLVLIGGRDQVFRQMILNLTQLCCENLQRRRILEAANVIAASEGIASEHLTSAAVTSLAATASTLMSMSGLSGNDLQQSSTIVNLSTHHLDEIGKDGAIQISRDNIDVCVSIMVRVSIHRTMQELERHLVPTYDMIRRSKSLSSAEHLTTFISSVHNERLPESLRIKPGEIPDNLLINYKQFARTIASFNPLPDDVCCDIINIEFAHYLERVSAELFTLVSYMNSDHCADKSNLSKAEVFIPLNDQVQRLEKTIQDIQSQFNLNKIDFGHDVFEASTTVLVEVCHCFMQIYDEQILYLLTNATTTRIQECFFNIFRHATETNIIGPAWNCKTLSRAIVQCPHKFRNNLLALPIFIKFRLLNLCELDVELRSEFRSVDNLNESSLNFAVNLLRYCLLECGNPVGTTSSSLCIPAGPISYSLNELQFTLDALHRCSVLNPMVDEATWNVLEVIRINYDLFNLHQDNNVRVSGAYRPLLGLSVLYSAIAQVRSDSIRAFHTPAPYADLHDRTTRLFANWLNIHRSIPGVDLSDNDAHQVFANFILQMNGNGIFKADECINGFFRCCIQICITRAYDLLRRIELSSQDESEETVDKENYLTGAVPPLNTFGSNHENGRFFNRSAVCQFSSASRYHELFEVCDAFVQLIVLLVRHSGDARSYAVKISLLNKVLGLVSGCCLIDAEIRGVSFYPLPYQRIFLTMFRDLCAAQFLNDSTHYFFTQSIMSAYFLLNPLNCPSFTFAWLELIGHGPFIGKVLQSTGQVKNTQCWTMYCSLLCALLRFIGPFIATSTSGDFSNDHWVAHVFKCTLRIFLILLHDFPEFLIEYSYELVEHIPSNCIQLRNLILSAYPRQMKLPDPSNPLLKVDLLAEINITPPVSYNYQCRIQPQQFKSSLDNYLQSRTPSTFLAALRSNISHTHGYNVKIINSLVLYVGIRSIDRLIRRGLHIATEHVGDCAHMDIFESLLTDLDLEGREIFLNAMLNSIRYPSSHTHFFGCAILYLFSWTDSMVIKEQMTRLLVERLIVHRPHPWGIRVTFAELVRNKTYRLVECPFALKIPQIQSLFESAIMGTPFVNQRLTVRSATATSATASSSLSK